MIESLGFIQDILHHLNYFWVTVLMAIESSFIPFPSEVVVPPAAYKAATGEMNIFLVVLFATLGSDIGALINYYLARYLGRPIVYKFANSRIGRLCLLSQEKIEKAEAYFVKNGISSTLIGRLVPGIRQLISIPAGLAGMPLGRFLLYTPSVPDRGTSSWHSSATSSVRPYRPSSSPRPSSAIARRSASSSSASSSSVVSATTSTSAVRRLPNPRAHHYHL